jgi:hypothetical protein
MGVAHVSRFRSGAAICQYAQAVGTVSVQHGEWERDPEARGLELD